uniref:G protein-coupled receptor class C group 6 member A n=1 Tax=Nothobranchius furzeri TaxID=105023 RepID=A0A8C6P0N3_NOTFU
MFLLKCIHFLGLFYFTNAALHAYSPGNIVIGGLFPIHSHTNRTTRARDAVCIDYDTQLFLHSQVMIHAIEEVNQCTPALLPNLTLGYDIYDTCGDVSLAIRATLQLMKNQSDPQSCLVPESIDSYLPEPETKVLIGERSSEVSIAISRILALTSVTQISHASTSVVLSKRFKFPTFFRTVPSDEFQTMAIYELVNELNWKTVAIIGSDDEYGKYGSDGLQSIFDKNNICVEFVEILSGNFNQDCLYTSKTLQNLMTKIEMSTAEAIIMFTKGANVETILKEVIENNLNRTWIASDTWSTSLAISTMAGINQIGQVFGFIFKRNEVPGFKDYVHSMFNGTKNHFIDYHLNQFPLCQNQTGNTTCSRSMNCTDPDCLASLVDQDESYSIYLAVQVIAEGLRRVLRCDDQSCARTEFTTFEVKIFYTTVKVPLEIQKVNITVGVTNLHFNGGDPSLGYEIVYWNQSESENSKKIQTIGDCGENNSTKCEKCGDWEYPNHLRNKCVEKTEDFLQWEDPVSISLCFFAILAIIIITAFAVVIRLNAGTPVVKAIGGYLCFLELLSLLLTFSLTFTFLGKPTKLSCVAIPLFGVGFSLCMSCILSNLLQILLGFIFDVNVPSWIKKFNQPAVVVLTTSGIQLVVSLSWLIVVPPNPTEEIKNTTILYQCEMNKESQKFFIATITYISLLGFICFLFAIKGRELPDLYRNAVLISISMVMFLIIWIIFLPLFLTLEGRYRPASNCAAILISGYSILGCHLAPKCYIMLIKCAGAEKPQNLLDTGPPGPGLGTPGLKDAWEGLRVELVLSYK